MDDLGAVVPVIRWPLVLFEQDDYPGVAETPDDMAEMYEDNFWDEVAAAFDADLRPVAIQVTSAGLHLRVSHLTQREDFARHARAALKRNARLTRWRRVRADAAESARIDSLTPEQLRREMVSRDWR